MGARPGSAERISTGEFRPGQSASGLPQGPGRGAIGGRRSPRMRHESRAGVCETLDGDEMDALSDGEGHALAHEVPVSADGVEPAWARRGAGLRWQVGTQGRDIARAWSGHPAAGGSTSARPRSSRRDPACEGASVPICFPSALWEAEGDTHRGRSSGQPRARPELLPRRAMRIILRRSPGPLLGSSPEFTALGRSNGARGGGHAAAYTARTAGERSGRRASHPASLRVRGKLFWTRARPQTPPPGATVANCFRTSEWKAGWDAWPHDCWWAERNVDERGNERTGPCTLTR
jgi:hypothetical protein